MMDRSNRPNGAPRGGLIEMMVETANENELVEWAFKHDLKKNGKIIFYRRDANSQMRTVTFNDAYCVYFKEIFTADGKNPMVTRITISARQLTIANQSITNAWAGMNSSGGSSSGASQGEISSFNAAEN
jgi:hypothetical protein